MLDAPCAAPSGVPARADTAGSTVVPVPVVEMPLDGRTSLDCGVTAHVETVPDTDAAFFAVVAASGPWPEARARTARRRTIRRLRTDTATAREDTPDRAGPGRAGPGSRPTRHDAGRRRVRPDQRSPPTA
ncbi:hypothetical protein [Pseudonocardia sp. HH130629-09]|uniref:hypothetical protein n=1 Tax=Pseudonocardia sp. HH130629-09 TaxID=1641402 RepID=UPI000AA037C6|nr:hypothetical protein [Pseudonocardia sp. HH130629-09]